MRYTAFPLLPFQLHYLPFPMWFIPYIFNSINSMWRLSMPNLIVIQCSWCSIVVCIITHNCYTTCAVIGNKLATLFHTLCNRTCIYMVVSSNHITKLMKIELDIAIQQSYLIFSCLFLSYSHQLLLRTI